MLLLCFTFVGVFMEVLSFMEDLKHELDILDEIIRRSSASGLDAMKKHSDELTVKSSGAQNEAAALIDEHTHDLMMNLQLFTELLENSNSENITKCRDGLDLSIGIFREKGFKKLKRGVRGLIEKSRSIIDRSVPLLTKMQNRTLKLREMARDCLRYEQTKCDGESIFRKVHHLQEAIPLVVEAIIDRLETQIRVLHSEVVLQTRKTVNFVVDAYSSILFSFIRCSL